MLDNFIVYYNYYIYIFFLVYFLINSQTITAKLFVVDHDAFVKGLANNYNTDIFFEESLRTACHCLSHVCVCVPSDSIGVRKGSYQGDESPPPLATHRCKNVV